MLAGADVDARICVLVQVVGGEDKYRAVCRACYNKALAEKAKQRRRQSIGVIRCEACSALPSGAQALANIDEFITRRRMPGRSDRSIWHSDTRVPTLPSPRSSAIPPCGQAAVLILLSWCAVGAFAVDHGDHPSRSHATYVRAGNETSWMSRLAVRSCRR